MADNNSGGIGIGMVLFLIFLVLKLVGVITWSWWWVFSPIWIPIAIVVVFGGLGLIVGALNSRSWKS